ncbi:MAG: hypothetical protein Q4E47_00885 [Candidatus Saccharibacteria bacterium]|nr:hypothetical protein [Candidatus Saccharibacteria bacterium]
MDNVAWQKEKTEYLIDTFSRSKENKYENYIVNALYQRIGLPDLRPVAKAFVRSKNEVYHETSLYFPQVNISVKVLSEETPAEIKDETELSLEIFDCLSPDETRPDFEEYEFEADLGFAELTEKIDTLALIIKKAWNNIPSNRKTWEHAESAEEYYVSRDMVNSSDPVIFDNVEEACNILFNSQFEDKFTGFKYLKIDGNNEYSHTVWRPSIAVPEEETGNYITTFEGDEIKETLPIYEAKPKTEKDKLPRITFIKVTDPETKKEGYRFAGVYQWFSEYDAVVNRVNIYKRTKTSFPILEK